MADLADLLAPYLGGREPFRAGEPVEARELVEPGASLRAQRTQLAELLSGGAAKNTTAYRSARASATRWLPSQGRRATRPSPANRGRLALIRWTQTGDVAAYRRAGANMRLYIVWYEGQRGQWIPAHDWQPISAATMRDVTDLWGDGSPNEAAETLWEAFLSGYRVPNPDDWLADVTIEDLRLARRI